MTARRSPSTNARASPRSSKRDGSPRYRRVADELAAAIATGRYPVGSTLPTEYQLCDAFAVSRSTVREAMRLLREAGFVTSRPRTGTVVVALNGTRPYMQTMNSIEDIRQYAEDTAIRIIRLGRVKVDQALARDLPLGLGENWHAVLAVRYQKKTDIPLCITRIYVNPAFKDLPRLLRGAGDAIYKLLERRYGIVVDRVEQRIYAVELSDEDALSLKAQPGSPALRNIRLYYDDADRLIEATDNIHPGDRFSYSMSVKKSPER